MAGKKWLGRELFPLRSVRNVIDFFRIQLEGSEEPNLTILSLVIGSAEVALTNKSISSENGQDVQYSVSSSSPGGESSSTTYRLAEEKESLRPRRVVNLQEEVMQLELAHLSSLSSKFEARIRANVDIVECCGVGSKHATRQLIKRVADVLWSSLSRSYYKDRPHIQTLYSYLTGNKLDCFGVAYAVVAACQLLGFDDVHLALSEDHAWVIFGENGNESAEVTWHGKGIEDKRGQAVTNELSFKSWLYLNGHPVKCLHRNMEVAALLSSINPTINTNMDSLELGSLQQNLLWMLYDMGSLNMYPMGLGCLGDLEEICPTPGRPSCLDLFQMAIACSIEHYNNGIVYPYTYLGGYFYRQHQFKEALDAWSKAAQVIRTYNYSRDDEEVYKEFLEIANDLIPIMMKEASSGHNARSIVKDPECFARLLQFYDGLCQWEEDSPTPILHIGWAKPLVATIGKFDSTVRSHVQINPLRIVTDETAPSSDSEHSLSTSNEMLPSPSEEALGKRTMVLRGSKVLEISPDSARRSRKRGTTEKVNVEAALRNTGIPTDLIKAIEGHIDPADLLIPPSVRFASLAASCAEKILKPKFYLSSEDLFLDDSLLESKAETMTVPVSDSQSDDSQGLLEEGDEPEYTDEDRGDQEQEEEEHYSSHEIQSKHLKEQVGGGLNLLNVSVEEDEDEVEIENENRNANSDLGLDKVFLRRPSIELRSQKMQGMKNLLFSERLNTHAIQLQLTAQSQVQVAKRSRFSTDVELQSIPLSSFSKAKKAKAE